MQTFREYLLDELKAKQAETNKDNEAPASNQSPPPPKPDKS